MKKKFYIKTYGCQMNDLDGQQMGRLLHQRGYISTEDPEEAGVILINTCSVREKASQKVYSEVGRFRSIKLKKPEVVLGVTGCQGQAEGMHLQKRFPYLDLVIGPDHISKIPELVESLLQDPCRGAINCAPTVNFKSREDYQFLNLLPDEEENQAKAFVTIMKGCDNFCSFCIVPSVRGREVCRDPLEIIAEVKALAEQGVQEVTLLGQNVNSYGIGRHAAVRGAIAFPNLLQRISEETRIERIRFTTSHPKDFSEELINQFRTNPKLTKHFHLPIQSGSDSVLERMYRGYTQADYMEKLTHLREACPDLAISTDIIVGFCQETEEEFAATMDLLKKVRYDSLYSFVYSPRPKTTAGIYFKDDIPEGVKQERLSRVQDLQNQITLENNKNYEGKILEVLAEGPSRRGDTYCGRSSQNHAVHFQGIEEDVGRILKIKITHAGPNSLRGEKYG